MWYVSRRERRIIISNGRQNKIEVNTYVSVTVSIATGYKENQSCHRSKKEGVTKVLSGESVMK